MSMDAAPVTHVYPEGEKKGLSIELSPERTDKKWYIFWLVSELFALILWCHVFFKSYIHYSFPFLPHFKFNIYPWIYIVIVLSYQFIAFRLFGFWKSLRILSKVSFYPLYFVGWRLPKIILGFISRLKRSLLGFRGIFSLALLIAVSAFLSIGIDPMQKAYIEYSAFALSLSSILVMMLFISWIISPVKPIKELVFGMTQNYYFDVEKELRKKSESKDPTKIQDDMIDYLGSTYSIIAFLKKKLTESGSMFTIKSLVFFLFIGGFIFCFIISTSCYATAYWGLHRTDAAIFPEIKSYFDSFFYTLLIFFGYCNVFSANVWGKFVIVSQILTSIFYIAITIGAFQIISFESTENTIADIKKRFEECLSIIERLGTINNISIDAIRVASKKTKNDPGAIFPLFKRLFALIRKDKSKLKHNSIIYSSGGHDEYFDADNNKWTPAMIMKSQPEWKEIPPASYIGVEQINVDAKSGRKINLRRALYVPPGTQIISAKLESSAVDECEFIFNVKYPLSVKGYTDITNHAIETFLEPGHNSVTMLLQGSKTDDSKDKSTIGVSYKISIEFEA